MEETETSEDTTEKPAEEKEETAEEPASEDEEAPLDRAERLNKEKAELLEREEKLMERKEKLAAEEAVGGRAVAGGTAKPPKLTDTEYAEALQRGEVNPLKEDGFI